MDDACGQVVGILENTGGSGMSTKIETAACTCLFIFTRCITRTLGATPPCTEKWNHVRSSVAKGVPAQSFAIQPLNSRTFSCSHEHRAELRLPSGLSRRSTRSRFPESKSDENSRPPSSARMMAISRAHRGLCEETVQCRSIALTEHF